MLENEYFEQFVRIQEERGHRVVTTGPYRFVRHPGYLAAILGALATPLMLGSAWTFVPAGLLGLLFVVRTYLEDETLQRELDGYKEYSEGTQFRLLPFLWWRGHARRLRHLALEALQPDASGCSRDGPRRSGRFPCRR